MLGGAVRPVMEEIPSAVVTSEVACVSGNRYRPCHGASTLALSRTVLQAGAVAGGLRNGQQGLRGRPPQVSLPWQLAGACGNYLVTMATRPDLRELNPFCEALQSRVGGQLSQWALGGTLSPTGVGVPCPENLSEDLRFSCCSERQYPPGIVCPWPGRGGAEASPLLASSSEVSCGRPRAVAHDSLDLPGVSWTRRYCGAHLPV